MINRLIILGFIIFSCNTNQVEKNVWKGFNPKDLEKAWLLKDSTTILNWINSLNDTSISDIDFYNRVTFLSGVTKFKYGIADPADRGNGYWTIPLEVRVIHKRNIARVYQLYSKSKLFMQLTDNEKTVLLQDKYWNDTTDLNPDQLNKLRLAIDSLGNK